MDAAPAPPSEPCRLRSRSSAAAEPDEQAATRRAVAAAVRWEQERRGEGEAAAAVRPADICRDGRCEVGAIRARIDVVRVVQVPFIGIARQIELAPESRSERRRPYGRDVGQVRAAARLYAARVVAPVDRVLVSRPRIRQAPRILSLLAPACR